MGFIKKKRKKLHHKLATISRYMDFYHISMLSFDFGCFTLGKWKQNIIKMCILTDILDLPFEELSMKDNLLKVFPSRYIIVQSQQRKYENNVWNLSKIDNENTRLTSVTSFWCFYCQLWTYFTYCPDVYIVNFEQANTD